MYLRTTRLVLLLYLENVATEVRVRLVNGHEEGQSRLELQQVQHERHKDTQVAGVLLRQPQHDALRVGVLKKDKKIHVP